MKVKLDENLPQALVGLLGRYAHDVDTVPQENLSGHEDNDVWAAAVQAGRFLITQDMDFSDIRKFQPGSHPGLLLVRLHEPGRMAIMRKMEAVLRGDDLNDWQRCFVVVTDHKIRVRRPAT